MEELRDHLIAEATKEGVAPSDKAALANQALDIDRDLFHREVQAKLERGDSLGYQDLDSRVKQIEEQLADVKAEKKGKAKKGGK